MYFDQGYYSSKHAELARQLMAGKVNYIKMQVEFDMVLLVDEEKIISPCIFVLYVNSRQDVEEFINFRKSDAAKELKNDMQNYTNCAVEWSVAKVFEA